jgi:thymidine kinase
MAKLYFSYSAMNAGKSTILLQSAHNYEERGMRTMLFTSAHHEGPDEGQIRSRLGLSVNAHVFRQADDLFEVVQAAHEASKLDCIFVDEAQFLTGTQVWQLARVADRLGIPVLCYGLRTDFRGELFAGSAQLLAIADSLREIRTICHCGAKATMVVRRGADGMAAREGEQVGVEREDYVSLCRKHWEDEMGRWPTADGSNASAGMFMSSPRVTSSP